MSVLISQEAAVTLALVTFIYYKMSKVNDLGILIEMYNAKNISKDIFLVKGETSDSPCCLSLCEGETGGILRHPRWKVSVTQVGQLVNQLIN